MSSGLSVDGAMVRVQMLQVQEIAALVDAIHRLVDDGE